jgi:DNA-binding LytR/AlgR family response regulator
MSTAGPLRILAVDDEPGALEDIARLLRATEVGGGPVEVVCVRDGDEALRRVGAEGFDAVFLDVRMEGLDGLELARILHRFAEPPELVFVSAHDDAAVEAFELHALDYLRKPVARARVDEAVTRVRAARSELASPGVVGAGATDPEMVAVSTLHGDARRLLARDEITFVTSHGDFVRIVTADGRFLLRRTLSEIERRWAPYGFVRVHRQFVANLHRAVELRPQLGGTAELVFADGAAVPVARRHLAELDRLLRAT